MRDTTPEADAAVRAAILRVPRHERMRQALELSETMRTLALTRLRTRYPECTTLELVELMLGEQLVPRNSVTDQP